MAKYLYRPLNPKHRNPALILTLDTADKGWDRAAELERRRRRLGEYPFDEVRHQTSSTEGSTPNHPSSLENQ